MRMSRTWLGAALLSVSASTILAAQAPIAGKSALRAQPAAAQGGGRTTKTTIYAPMSGRVTRLNVEVGETAIQGTMNKDAALLLTISDMSVLETKVKVDETDVTRISLGDSAVVQIDAFPDTTFLGRVTKARILDAVREAKGEKAAERMVHLKKAEMAKEAEGLLDGTGWLPEPLRTAGAGSAATKDVEHAPHVMAAE